MPARTCSGRVKILGSNGQNTWLTPLPAVPHIIESMNLKEGKVSKTHESSGCWSDPSCRTCDWVIGLFVLFENAQAVPSYARQTDMSCNGFDTVSIRSWCHFNVNLSSLETLPLKTASHANSPRCWLACYLYFLAILTTASHLNV